MVGKSFEEHLRNLAQVFDQLRSASLKLKPQKCAFACKQVEFLGHIVSAQGVSTDPGKTAQVANWPEPQSTQEVQQFLGLASYYRRFVKNFAEVARPLYYLLQKSRAFRWTRECQEAFTELKGRLTSAPILASPDFSKPFILDTVASDNGIRAVLSQHDEDGGERVIAYASRALSKPERNYCVTRRELLAVVYFTHHFREYLLGRHFTLRTDHHSLSWMRNFKEPVGQLARWLEQLEEYTFTTIHRPGKRHGNADALSRLPCRQCGQQEPSPEPHASVVVSRVSLPCRYSQNDLRRAQLEDPVIGPILSAREDDRKPSNADAKGKSSHYRRLLQLWDQLIVQDWLLWRCYENDDGSSQHTQLIVPCSLRDQVLRDMHGGAMSGHFGEDKTLSRLREGFYWPGFHTDVKLWCQTCQDCARQKMPTPKRKAPLQNMQVGSPMQVVAVDILGPLPKSSTGNQYILVAGDYFTKWMEAYAIPNQEAETVARVVTEEMFLRFSPPEQLRTFRSGTPV